MSQHWNSKLVTAIVLLPARFSFMIATKKNKKFVSMSMFQRQRWLVSDFVRVCLFPLRGREHFMAKLNTTFCTIYRCDRIKVNVAYSVTLSLLTYFPLSHNAMLTRHRKFEMEIRICKELTVSASSMWNRFILNEMAVCSFVQNVHFETPRRCPIKWKNDAKNAKRNSFNLCAKRAIVNRYFP